MKNVRHNVFETNSSSSHSLSIAEDEDGILDTLDMDPGGVITIVGEYFGRTWEAYNNPMVKASYCLSDNRDNHDRIEMLRGVIIEHTGCVDVDFVINGDSYVDHQSAGLTNEVFYDKHTLKKFLFDPRSCLFLGHDESPPPPNFYDYGKNLKYQYKLEVDDVDLVFRFTDKPDLNSDEFIEAIHSLIDLHPNNKYGSSRDYYYDDMEIVEIDDNGEEVQVKSPNNRDFVFTGKCTFKDIEGEKYSSLMDVDKGVIYLYKKNPVYKGTKFVGDKILETLGVYFEIVKI